MTDETKDDSANVLAFTKRFDANSDIKEMRNVVEAEKPTGPRCRHERVVIDEHRRMLNCRLCGQVIETFDWVMDIAKKETRLDWELRLLRTEITSHREGLEKLKREEVNCKARIKDAAFKLNGIQGDIDKANQELVFITKRVQAVKK